MGAFGDILGSIVPNAHFWKRSGAWDMSILPDLLDLDLHIFAISSKIIDLDIQIYDFWNNLKNLKVQIRQTCHWVENGY